MLCRGSEGIALLCYNTSRSFLFLPQNVYAAHIFMHPPHCIIYFCPCIEPMSIYDVNESWKNQDLQAVGLTIGQSLFFMFVNTAWSFRVHLNLTVFNDSNHSAL